MPQCALYLTLIIILHWCKLSGVLSLAGIIFCVMSIGELICIVTRLLSVTQCITESEHRNGAIAVCATDGQTNLVRIYIILTIQYNSAPSPFSFYLKSKNKQVFDLSRLGNTGRKY